MSSHTTAKWLTGPAHYIGKLADVVRIGALSEERMVFRFEDDTAVSYSNRFPVLYGNQLRSIVMVFFGEDEEEIEKRFTDTCVKIMNEAVETGVLTTHEQVVSNARLSLLRALIGHTFAIEAVLRKSKHTNRTYTTFVWARVAKDEVVAGIIGTGSTE